MKLNNKDYENDDLKDTNWLGEVVDIDDPLNLGRVRVKVFGKFEDIPTDKIPWATPSNNFIGGSSTGGGLYSVPKIGSIVNINFDNGNIYAPEYTYIQKISNELKDEVSNNPTNFHSLLYDTEVNGGLKLYYTEDKGLMLDLNSSIINIRKDNSIFIEYKNGIKLHLTQNMISLGSENKSAEPGVLGNKNADVLNELSDRLIDLINYIIAYTTAQAAITGALVIFAPLTPALTALNATAVSLLPLIAKIKSISIPLTKSQKISLD